MSEQPEWFEDAAKVLQWLETQREQGNEAYFTPAAIAYGSHVSITTVQLTIKNADELIERKGKKVRFNLDWRIKNTLKEMVENGLMKETSPRQFSMTKAGELYTQNLLMTNPEAQKMYRKLSKK